MNLAGLTDRLKTLADNPLAAVAFLAGLGLFTYSAVCGDSAAQTAGQTLMAIGGFVAMDVPSVNKPAA